ncbi:helix-hairpin-helix domain-containing protein [Pseudohalocynthiibacter sp. F2068]|jgi:Helix-hairpin-helix domain|uniref:helix-hairpin-helix domain-containing protein n=1 Tax=Pseudohalocynthiibacter sp. F2068 TaxID=2926418 RepID=UPI001FF4FC6D|nr:helix-hairpin-helix domain-containing protein [Pseudohalocynthiibacter sp. F2068]MCK0103850.1 helix-hairpin-helix domain-containing protein [Pseudohalocynthiibacter sp. F2068]
MTFILDVPGIGPHLASKLTEKGISTAEEFAATSPTALLEVPGIGARRVEILLKAARQVITDAPKVYPKSHKASVRAAASKVSGDARAKAEDTAIADEAMTPAVPKKAAKKTNKKKADKGKASKKAKAKNKSKEKKQASKKKSKEKAAAAKKAAAKKSKKAAVKKGKARKKDKKDRKSKKK